MNPVPSFIACFLLGYYLGLRAGLAYEEEPALSWEELQREAAREGLQ